ncbi:MAG: hypothetical protein DI536_03565 [Archangium gephyra]|uniref:Uncharacterized protein n=1 Tax=Archangium gephyra TaxID=48 RepID=A0A2W5TVU2_9BACT|nr:MAG: hypothetical protein DI536_03565 [Archangium gephyra]
MAILNITYQGLSADYGVELDTQLTDADVRRVAVEVVRAGNVPGLNLPHLADDAFAGFVVDRMQNGQRIYLRPKVPFGA